MRKKVSLIVLLLSFAFFLFFFFKKKDFSSIFSKYFSQIILIPFIFLYYSEENVKTDRNVPPNEEQGIDIERKASDTQNIGNKQISNTQQSATMSQKTETTPENVLESRARCLDSMAPGSSITTKADVHNSVEESAQMQPKESEDALKNVQLQKEPEKPDGIDIVSESQILTEISEDKKLVESISENGPPQQENVVNSSSVDKETSKESQEMEKPEMNVNLEGIKTTITIESPTSVEVLSDQNVEDSSNSKQAENSSENKSNGNGNGKDSTKNQIEESGDTEKKADAGDEKSMTDASKSFQVLPGEKQQSDNSNQELDDTGNLSPSKPPTETIRKTSFTVLKGDESIEDLLAGMDGPPARGSKDDIGVKILSRPKSFKVLKTQEASGEDIILHQSSDQETGENEIYDEYSTKNIAHSGKYSDSELIKSENQINGRRKKFKKRVKSVKQFTFADGQSKDHDSGFEPSPRAIRSSQKALTTRAIYTANLSENINDGRLATSRFEQQRKLGDKSAVNMTTVSQSIQRNIRR